LKIDRSVRVYSFEIWINFAKYVDLLFFIFFQAKIILIFSEIYILVIFFYCSMKISRSSNNYFYFYLNIFKKLIGQCNWWKTFTIENLFRI